MYRILGSFVILAVMLAQPVFSAQKIRVANSGDYPPYYYYDQGRLVGFDIDITQALCQVLGLEYEIVVTPWDDIISQLTAGKVDVIIAEMAKTPEREKLVAFTDYYSRSSASFMGKVKTDIQISEAGLKGKTLAAVRGSYQQEYLEKQYGSVATIIVFDGIEQTIEALSSGKADLVLDDSLVLFYFMKRAGGDQFDLVGDPLPSDDPSNLAYIAVRKEDDKLRNAFNQAIKTIRLDGTFTKISNKYFPFSTY